MTRFSLHAALLTLFIGSSALSQTLSVQLTIKEKSGFLGMGGPKIGTLYLSTERGDTVLTSEKVNAGPYFYFLLKPSGDWAIDQDIVKENIATLNVYQNTQTFAIAWKGDIVAGPPTTILLGFPKDIKLHQLFLLRLPVDDKVSQAEMNVPREFWPGYDFIIPKARSVADAMTASDALSAIHIAEEVIPRSELAIFPQYEQLKSVRTTAFRMHLDVVDNEFQAAIAAPGELKTKMAAIESFRPRFQFVVDSLPRSAWGIGSLDANVAPIIERARLRIDRVQEVNDSLMQRLEDLNTRWILEGSSTGKDGFKFQYMIETLAYAMSSMNFEDTTTTALVVSVPEPYLERLDRYSITESYETFIRICDQRFRSGLPMFPVEFLPNLRKDTASFVQPYYSMLKAVSDYYYGLLNGALTEISNILIACTEADLNAKYDHMRVLIDIRNGKAPAEVLRILDDAKKAEARGDNDGALQGYRQATVLAPNFAYGFFSLGQFYTRTGDPIRAINFFQQAYRIDTLFISAYREAYSLYMRQGNYKPMIEVLTFALQHGNDTWEINSNIGTAYLGDNDPARAIVYFERALQLNGKSYNTNIQLGLAYQTIKDFTRAREYFNSAIGLDPVRQEAVNYLQRLNEVERGEN